MQVKESPIKAAGKGMGVRSWLVTSAERGRKNKKGKGKGYRERRKEKGELDLRVTRAE